MVAVKFDAQDNEWLKIVASTCLGLIAGLIAEPLKSGIAGRRIRREVSDAIRNDLRLIQRLLPFYRLDKYNAKQISKAIELPAYEHYWSTSKKVFYESAHLGYLRLQCSFILSDIDRIREGLCTKLEGLKSIEENVSSALKHREANLVQRLILKYRRSRWKRKYGDTAGCFIMDGEPVPAERVVFVDEHGKPIPEGEGKGSGSAPQRQSQPAPPISGLPNA